MFLVELFEGNFFQTTLEASIAVLFEVAAASVDLTLERYFFQGAVEAAIAVPFEVAAANVLTKINS